MPAFSLSSFTLIKSFFSSSLSAIRVVSSAYLKLLVFLLAILIPGCASSSLAFCLIYSVYKYNKQRDNTQHWHTPLPIWNQSVVPGRVLTVVSWPAYKRQVRWSGIPISWRILQFVVIHTVKCFGIVNKEEADIFLEFSCFFDDPTDVGNLISGSSAFSKSSLNIWKLSIHLLLKPSLKNFEHYLAGMWASLVAQTVKCLAAMLETWVWFLGWEDHLEKEMAIHSSTLAWKIPWMEEPDRLQFMGSKRVGHD